MKRHQIVPLRERELLFVILEINSHYSKYGTNIKIVQYKIRPSKTAIFNGIRISNDSFGDKFQKSVLSSTFVQRFICLFSISLNRLVLPGWAGSDLRESYATTFLKFKPVSLLLCLNGLYVRSWHFTTAVRCKVIPPIFCLHSFC